MENRLIDLNNYLFQTIDFLAESKSHEAVDREINKAKAICAVSAQIIDIHRLALDAAKFVNPTKEKMKEISAVFSLEADDQSLDSNGLPKLDDKGP